MIYQDENQHNIVEGRTITVEATTLVARGATNGHKGACPNIQRTEWSIKQATNLQLICDYCKRSDHTKDRCFQIIGYPNWWKGKSVHKPLANNAQSTQ